jgi:hypothetical protein
LLSLDPTVSECGVESLGFEFPGTPYAGHFTEDGYNALAMNGVSDCWARNLQIRNADSGIFVSGVFCTVQGVSFASDRQPDEENHTGHHGVYYGGDDNVLAGFDFQTRFIHDISVASSAGNVFEDGKGLDLCFDHHRRAPYENLFANLDAGKGSRLWRCGGGAGLGKHCASRGTFWNIQAERPLSYPESNFGPKTMNLVGLTADEASSTDPSGLWFETFENSKVQPGNIHKAQLEKRIRGKENSASEDPPLRPRP